MIFPAGALPPPEMWYNSPPMNEVEKQIEDVDRDLNAPAKSPDKIEKKEEYQK